MRINWLATVRLQVSSPGGAWVDEVQNHHHQDDGGHSNRPPLRNSAYATKLAAPTSVQAVTRINALASLWLVGRERRRPAATRDVPISRRRWMSSKNLVITINHLVSQVNVKSYRKREITTEMVQAFNSSSTDVYP